jgi:hypothetical protein
VNWKFELILYLTRPTSQWPKQIYPHAPVTQTRVARHRPGHHAVTALGTESAQAPITAGHHRCPMPRRPYPWGMGAVESSSPFHLPHRHTRPPSPSPFTIAGHHHILSLSFKPGKSFALTSSALSTTFELNSPNTPSGGAPLPTYSSFVSSPSTSVVHAPPAPPSPRGAPHDLVAHMGPHLHHRQHLVRTAVIVRVATGYLTVAHPPR